MRKHNRKFAQRWTRTKDDRSNFPQQMAHAFVKGKTNQLVCNGLLLGLLHRAIGLVKPGTTRKGSI
jgi:hypothetical protein